MDIGEQEAKLKVEAQRIGEELGRVQAEQQRLQQMQQGLINEALKNQGALEFVRSLDAQ